MHLKCDFSKESSVLGKRGICGRQESMGNAHMILQEYWEGHSFSTVFPTGDESKTVGICDQKILLREDDNQMNMVWIDATEIAGYLLLVFLSPVQTHTHTHKEKWTEQKVISESLALLAADKDSINYCHWSLSLCQAVTAIWYVRAPLRLFEQNQLSSLHFRLLISSCMKTSKYYIDI